MEPNPLADRPPRFVVGTMTGTSLDGEMDVAIVSVHGSGLGMRAPVVASKSFALGALASDLRRVSGQEPLPAREFARIARAFGDFHAESIDRLCASANVRPDLVVLHGQTVYHAPPLSWQLVDPWPVAVRMGCNVRYDLRGANLASGGEGAPITPLADFILFGDEATPATVVNLGGFANATLLPAKMRGPESIRGFDICPCNHLLDLVARTRLGRPFDEDGRAAAHGTANPEIAAAIVAAIDRAQRRHDAPVRSLGTGDEGAMAVGMTADLAPSDACATVVEAVAAMIARALRDAGHDAGTPIVVAGGSARHRVLREALARLSGSGVETSEEHAGVPVAMREAAAMAVLGALAEDGLRYALRQVTRAESIAIDSALITVPKGLGLAS